MNAAKAEEEVERIMKTVDTNHSGSIDYTGNFFRIYFPVVLFAFYRFRFHSQWHRTSEFVIASINRENLLSKQKLETAFKMFDKVSFYFYMKKTTKKLKDGSGSISIDEIKEIFGSYGNSISDKVWKEIIQEVDDNSDGQVKIQAF